MHSSPNIHDTPDVYEIENRAADPEMRIEAAIRALRDWEGLDVADVGCGTGFHLARFAEAARRVVGIEPHTPSRLAAVRRCAELGSANVEVLRGSAEQVPLGDASIDLVHARFAYFFGPGCEAGIAECRRLLRPGGVMVVIDNDLRHGTFASWLARSPWAPSHSAVEVEGFWTAQAFDLVRVPSRWAFESRHDLEAVIQIEFPPALAAELLAEHRGQAVDCHYALYWTRA